MRVMIEIIYSELDGGSHGDRIRKHGNKGRYYLLYVAVTGVHDFGKDFSLEICSPLHQHLGGYAKILVLSFIKIFCLSLLTFLLCEENEVYDFRI